MKVRKLTAIILYCSWLITDVACADIAYIAPVTIAAKTGAIFSNPAPLANDLDVYLTNANVQIKLSIPYKDVLLAEVEAEFVVNRSGSDRDVLQFLTAFPVCHYRHPFLTIDGFEVTVDGRYPTMVLRKTERVGYSFTSYDVSCDSPMYGSLPEHMSLPPLTKRWEEWEECCEPGGGGSGFPGVERLPQERVTLPDGSHYEYCYVWLIELEPGAQSRVVVNYTCIIPEQENIWQVENQYVYGGSESQLAHMTLNIPESFYHKVGPGSFFFFSYILQSGTTWQGPIGSETIRLTADNSVFLDRAILDIPVDIKLEPNELLIQISETDPDYDLILAIPAIRKERCLWFH